MYSAFQIKKVIKSSLIPGVTVNLKVMKLGNQSGEPQTERLTS